MKKKLWVSKYSLPFVCALLSGLSLLWAILCKSLSLSLSLSLSHSALGYSLPFVDNVKFFVV
jgi:hypothetical protein